MDPTAVEAIANALSSDVGVIVLGVAAGIALYKKKLVLGWLYEECVKDHQTCRGELERRVAHSEAELERLRSERRA
jgi:hypothetical protein